MYTHVAPLSLTSAGEDVALSSTSRSGASVFAFFVGSFPPAVFVSTAPLSSSVHVPDHATMPDQMHCTFGGQGDTLSSALKVLSSFSVMRRSYFLAPHDGDVNVPVQRSSGLDDRGGELEGSPLLAGSAEVACEGAGAAEGAVVPAGASVDEPGGDDVSCGGAVTGGFGESHPSAAAAAKTHAPRIVSERKMSSPAASEGARRGELVPLSGEVGAIASREAAEFERGESMRSRR